MWTCILAKLLHLIRLSVPCVNIICILVKTIALCQKTSSTLFMKLVNILGLQLHIQIIASRGESHYFQSTSLCLPWYEHLLRKIKHWNWQIEVCVIFVGNHIETVVTFFFSITTFHTVHEMKAWTCISYCN